MKLKDEVLRGIYSYGFDRPSVFQQKGILPIVRGQDVVAQVHSGAEKISAYSIACLQKVNPALPQTQALLLLATHELSLQSYDV